VCLLSPTSKRLFVELKAGRKTKACLFRIFCKVKDRTQRVSKSYNHDQEVHVCEYVVDGVKSKRVGCSMILSLPSYILGMANFLIFAWTFMCPFFSWTFMCPPFFSWAFMGPLLFSFSLHSSCPYWREFWEKLYGVWNIKKDRNEWMVWKCYFSSVEVLACGGGVYVILDHESMKSNSLRSQNLTKLKMTQAACKKIVSL